MFRNYVQCRLGNSSSSCGGSSNCYSMRPLCSLVRMFSEFCFTTKISRMVIFKAVTHMGKQHLFKIHAYILGLSRVLDWIVLVSCHLQSSWSRHLLSHGALIIWVHLLISLLFSATRQNVTELVLSDRGLIVVNLTIELKISICLLVLIFRRVSEVLLLSCFLTVSSLR